MLTRMAARITAPDAFKAEMKMQEAAAATLIDADIGEQRLRRRGLHHEHGIIHGALPRDRIQEATAAPYSRAENPPSPLLLLSCSRRVCGRCIWR
jgi:hypothetical protein